MKRVNGGVKIGRTWIGFRRTPSSRYAWRTGGQQTPGPWWELVIPHVGTLTINRDRTLFGWTDPDTGDGR